MLNIVIHAIWVPVVLSCFLIGLGHALQRPRIISCSIVGAWLGQYLFIIGPPNVPPAEASQWLFYVLVILPWIQRPTYSTKAYIGITIFSAVFFAVQMSSLFTVTTVLTISIIPSLVMVGAMMKLQRSPDSNPIFIWAVCIGISSLILGKTGSIIYATMQISVSIGLIFLFLYQTWTGENRAVQYAKTTFVVFMVAPLVLGYHFSFLPWYSAILLLLLPMVYSLSLTKWITVSLFFFLSALAIWSSTLLSETESNPYEQL